METRHIMKCYVCNKQKGKRVCPAANGAHICPPCCGQTREWKTCPVTCSFLPEEPGPNIYVKGGQLEQTSTGDIVRMCDFLFVPNLYSYVTCNVDHFRLRFLNTQVMDLTIGFVLKNHSASSFDEFYAKDGWKKQFHPFGAEDLAPLVGVALPGGGIVSLDERDLRLEGSRQFRVSVSHWLIAGPFQRPIMVPSRPNGSVSYVFARNVLCFGELRLDVHYRLNMRVLAFSNLVPGEARIVSVVGVISPYGCTTYGSPTIVMPPGLTITAGPPIVFGPGQAQAYPGESPDGTALEFTPLRGHESIVFGRSAEMQEETNSVQVSAVPSLAVWESTVRSDTGVSVSVITHDKSVNARLLPVLKRWIGNIASPIHLSILNPTGESQKVICRVTNQTTQDIALSTHLVDPLSPITVGLPLPNLQNEAPGTISLLVEVIDSRGKSLYIDDVELDLLPHDYAVLRIHDIGRDWYRNTTPLLACWVTPHAIEVSKWIGAARQFRPHGMLPGGDQAPGTPQVHALWDALELRGVTYVDRSYSIGTKAERLYQRVSPPELTLQLASGNCIDLSVLFASALEQLSLNPTIVLIPGHAMVGWTSAFDGNNSFLETTVLGRTTFQDALALGNIKFGQIRAKVNSELGYRTLGIPQLRRLGLTPIF